MFRSDPQDKFTDQVEALHTLEYQAPRLYSERRGGLGWTSCQDKQKKIDTRKVARVGRKLQNSRARLMPSNSGYNIRAATTVRPCAATPESEYSHERQAFWCRQSHKDRQLRHIYHPGHIFVIPIPALRRD